MANGSRQLSDGGDAICMGELHLHLVGLGLGAFALGQVDDECNTLISLLVKCGNAYQHGHAITVLVQVFLLKGQDGAGRLLTSATFNPSRVYNSGGVKVDLLKRPVARSSRSYPSMRRKASLASTDKDVIRLDTRTRRFPDECPDNVRRRPAPDLRLTLRDISRYRLAFSGAIAACEASSLRTAARAGTKT